MAENQKATGESLRAPFSREVVLYDQALFMEANAAGGAEKLKGKAVAMELLRGDGVYKADPLKFSDKRTSELCEHPIENGTPVSDHKILKPREFVLTVALPAYYGGKVLRTLNRYYETSDKIIVKCATGIYRNMVLVDLPVNITPNDLERPKYDLSFKEVFIVEPEKRDGGDAGKQTAFNATNPEDQNSVQYNGVAKEIPA